MTQFNTLDRTFNPNVTSLIKQVDSCKIGARHNHNQLNSHINNTNDIGFEIKALQQDTIVNFTYSTLPQKDQNHVAYSDIERNILFSCRQLFLTVLASEM